MRDIAFVDVETTGLDPESRVVEVAVFRTQPSGLFRFIDQDIRHWRVRPPEDCHVEEKALEINGFTWEKWKHEQTFKDIEPLLTDFLADAIVAGWNVKFDLGMLESEYSRLGLKVPWHYHSMDVMNYMMPLYFAGAVKSLSLAAACDYFRISNEGAHGARVDVLRTMAVFHRLSVMWGFFGGRMGYVTDGPDEDWPVDVTEDELELGRKF